MNRNINDDFNYLQNILRVQGKHKLLSDLIKIHNNALHQLEFLPPIKSETQIPEIEIRIETEIETGIKMEVVSLED